MTTQLTTEIYPKWGKFYRFWGAVVPTLSDDGAGSGRTFTGL